MDDKNALKPDRLSNRCDPNSFTFETTAELEPFTLFIGQKRAYEAIQFGIRITHDGYNLYALGPDDIGKQAIVEAILKQEAKHKQTPSDWCYVYNFSYPRCPVALQLPAGQGLILQHEMQNLIDNLTLSLPAIFDTKEHQAQIKQINEEVTIKQKEYFDSLQAEAEKHDMAILSTSKGFVVVPVKGERVLTAKDLRLLTDKEREEVEDITDELNEQLATVLNEIEKLHKNRPIQEKKFEREFAFDTVNQLINKIRIQFHNNPDVLKYLDDAQEDIISNVKLFLKVDEQQPAPVMYGESHPSEFVFSRYQVNVIIDNSKTQGAPVIYEDNPRYYKLFGRIEHVSQMGALVTDFTLIRQGSMHKANGGYLIIDTVKILEESWSWEALKRALTSKEITIELPPSSISVTSTSTLEPQAIPLDIKIILLGDREDYYLLRDTDSDFNDLFKVAVDFEERLDRNNDSIQLFAKLIATRAHVKNLRALDRTAVARIIEYSSRIIEDAEKFSLHIRTLDNLIEESDYWCAQEKRDIITKADVERAISSHIFRLDHYQQIIYEEIQRDILFINTQGKAISQINALITYRFGDFTFGFPSRITATARVGRDGIIDIEREVNLSGPIHSKGVLILSGFLRGRYATKYPLTLSASIVFEQSYCPIDGDSASVAELCTLLSALSHIPIKQNLAITGSVNQHGMVQSIGNVNEKIEGFFEICKVRGLTGDQGVLIPRSNIKNLMLKDEVIQAVREKLFFIYAIETVDQAITLLTDHPAGERNQRGNYPEGTVNYFVEKQLKEFAQISKKWIK